MLVIGIAGGTGSGKTTVVNKIINSFPAGEVAVMPQDSYYKDSSHIPPEERSKINFDEPDAIEWTLLVEHLKELKTGKTIQMPTYSYLTCTRQPETVEVCPTDVVIVEGILVLTDPVLRNMLDIKVFVDADADDRLIRVIARDCIERGRTPQMVIDRYALPVYRTVETLCRSHSAPRRQQYGCYQSAYRLYRESSSSSCRT